MRLPCHRLAIGTECSDGGVRPACGHHPLAIRGSGPFEHLRGSSSTSRAWHSRAGTPPPRSSQGSLCAGASVGKAPRTRCCAALSAWLTTWGDGVVDPMHGTCARVGAPVVSPDAEAQMSEPRSVATLDLQGGGGGQQEVVPQWHEMQQPCTRCDRVVGAAAGAEQRKTRAALHAQVQGRWRGGAGRRRGKGASWVVNVDVKGTALAEKVRDRKVEHLASERIEPA